MNRLVIFVLLFGMSKAAFGGIELVEIQMPASKLAGTIVDATGAVVEGAMVEVHTCSIRKDGALDMDEQVLAAAKTDADGRFSMPTKIRPSAACLRVQHDGFDPELIGIKWRHFAPSMKITLVIAT